MDNIRLLYIDLFCGAGGTSTGVEKANYKERKCAKVIACVNHDANAIASHAANHPEAQHYTEDMRTLDLRPLAEHTAEMRRMYPMAKVVLWASLECTNFSRAKGGQPRDADSRTLAEHLFRYIEALTPDYIQIENVEEFMSWGDLDENGKPISRDKGRLYTNWVDNVKAYGYKFDHRILNAITPIKLQRPPYSTSSTIEYLMQRIMGHIPAESVSSGYLPNRTYLLYGRSLPTQRPGAATFSAAWRSGNP